MSINIKMNKHIMVCTYNEVSSSKNLINTQHYGIITEVKCHFQDAVSRVHTFSIIYVDFSHLAEVVFDEVLHLI